MIRPVWLATPSLRVNKHGSIQRKLEIARAEFESLIRMSRVPGSYLKVVVGVIIIPVMKRAVNKDPSNKSLA